jgi:death-on-curing protein
VANSSEPLLLSVDEVLTLHDDQLHLFGGSAGIRDRGVLESAVAMRASTFDGVYLHSDLFEMAAAYAFHIAEGQPFVDGNKRTALNAALVFLDLDGWIVRDPDIRLYDGMIGFAIGEYDKMRFAALLKTLAVPIDEDEEPPHSP